MASTRASLLFLTALLYLDYCQSATLPRNYDPRLVDEVLVPKKRPFCNAFTGCGRKRSQTPGMPAQELIRQRQVRQSFYADEDNMGTYMNIDNPADELSRQIISGARLWEALQEANAALARRKQKENEFN